MNYIILINPVRLNQLLKTKSSKKLWGPNMTKYIISTESGADLPQTIIDQYYIHIVPMHVTMGNQTYSDGSFDVQKVFDYYDETKQLPKTSGTTPQDNANVFQQIFDEFPEACIIHIAYSAVTTISFNSANIAAEDYDRIYLVDAKNVSLGLTAIVKATAQFIKKNPKSTPEEIISFVEEIRERTRMVFLPKTLLYLKAGGRVSNLAFYGANILKIFPTIKIENGYLVAGKRYRGSFNRSVKKMINDFFDQYIIQPETVVVGGPPDVSDKEKEFVYEIIKENNIQINKWSDTGAVISTHGGPGAIGIAGIEAK